MDQNLIIILQELAKKLEKELNILGEYGENWKKHFSFNNKKVPTIGKNAEEITKAIPY